MKTIAAVVMTLCFASAAQTQDVWRCGPEGRAYSDSPCAQGRLVAVADPRNAAQIQAAQDVVARDRELARRMAQERRDNEREALSHSGLSGIKTPAAAPLKPTVRLAKKKPRPGLEEGGIWPSAVHATRHARG